MGRLVEAEPGCEEAGLEVVGLVWAGGRLGPGTMSGARVWVGNGAAVEDWRPW